MESHFWPKEANLMPQGNDFGVRQLIGDIICQIRDERGLNALEHTLQSVHIRPWKTISQHNIVSERNIKKTKYYVWTKYFDWKQTLLGSNISSGHNLHIVP